MTGGRTFVYDDLNRLTHSKAGILYYYRNHPQQPALTDGCPASIHPTAVTATSDGKHYCYDENGNTVSGDGRSFSWTVDNRIASVSAPGGLADMVYDHTGTRLKKDGSAGTTDFPFPGYEVNGTVATKYIRAAGEIVAAKKGGDKRFYHNDHLAGVNVITDIFAARCQLTEYDPWGSVSNLDGNCDPTHRFTGKELDPESGLYYYGARYYDAQLARFVSPDPFVQRFMIRRTSTATATRSTTHKSTPIRPETSSGCSLRGSPATISRRRGLCRRTLSAFCCRRFPRRSARVSKSLAA